MTGYSPGGKSVGTVSATVLSNTSPAAHSQPRRVLAAHHRAVGLHQRLRRRIASR